MQNSTLTNALLVLIAVLQLVLVIQNGMQSPSNYQRPALSSAPAAHDHGASVAAPAGAMGHNMIFQAVRAFPKGCEGANVLDDCNSPEAEAVKMTIMKEVEAGKGPRQIFDFIVATFGEKALTDEAQQIRAMRTKKQ